MYTEFIREVKEHGLESFKIFLIAGIIIGGMLGALIGGINIYKDYVDDNGTTKYTYVSYDNENITVKLYMSDSKDVKAWDFGTLNNNTNSSYRIIISGERQFKCWSNNTLNNPPVWVRHITFRGFGREGKLDLQVRVINYDTNYSEVKRVMHHSTKPK